MALMRWSVTINPATSAPPTVPLDSVPSTVRPGPCAETRSILCRNTLVEANATRNIASPNRATATLATATLSSSSMGY